MVGATPSTEVPGRLYVCERTKQVTTLQACLKCATEGPGCHIPRGFILSLINENGREGIHVTDITGCLRKGFYKRTEEPRATLLSAYAVRLYGTVIHDAFAKHDEEANTKLVLDFGDVQIVGTADAVYDGTIEDIKTTRWLQPYMLPYGNHLKQILYYAVMLWKSGKPVHKGIIRYVDLSGPSKCRKCKVQHSLCQCGAAIPKGAHNGFWAYTVFWTERDFEIAYQEMNTVVHQLQTAIQMNLAPDGTPSWECRYCDFSGQCKYAQLGAVDENQ